MTSVCLGKCKWFRTNRESDKGKVNAEPEIRLEISHEQDFEDPRHRKHYSFFLFLSLLCLSAYGLQV